MDPYLPRRAWLRMLALSLPTADLEAHSLPTRQANIGPVVSIREFGAVGDGRNDDAPALLKALESARPTGVAVYLPAGRYRCSHAVRSSTPCRMFGAGEQSQLVFDRDIRPAPPFRTLCIEAPDNPRPGEDSCELSDFSLDAQSDGPQGRLGDLMSGIGLIRVTGIVDHVTVRDTWGIGLVFHACHDLTIMACHVIRTGRDGITGFWENRRVWILNNVVEHPGDDGIAMNAADQVRGPALAEDVHIVGNHVTQGEHFGRGIYLAGVARARVTQNAIQSVVSSGIAVQPNALTGTRSKDVEITSNRVANAGALPEARQPLESIRIETADRVRIIDNVLEFSGGQGVFVHKCTNVGIRGNLVRDCGKATPASALDCRDVQGLSIVANECSGGSGPGVLIESVSRARVLSNVVEGQPQALLLVRGSSDDTIVSANVLAAASRSVVDALRAELPAGASVLFAQNLVILAQGTPGDLPGSFRAVGNQVITDAR